MITKLIVSLTIIGWIIWDIVAHKFGNPTESMVIRDWGWKFTVFSFTIGFLVGHWLFTRPTVDISGWMWSLPIMGGLLLFDGLWSYFNMPMYVWYRYPGGYAILGAFIGSWLWGQKYS